jgi:RecA/RadA recombinase
MTTTSKLDFLNDFDKSTKGMEGVATESKPPKFWISLGNYALNKAISPSYSKGIAQGRMMMVAGPSGAGKSFIIGNLIKDALSKDIGVLVVDSEGALDEAFLTAIGADVVDNPLYTYRGVSKISQCIEIVSKFIKSYRNAKMDHPFLIVIDSLDYLQTDSESNAYEGGELKGDQGQQVKQLKKMVGAYMHDIKGINIAMVCSKHVYKEQDAIKALREPYVITESVKFAFSQVLMITKLMLKDDTTKLFEGIVLKAIGNKTRFTKPFQQVKIDVPYDTGMDPFSGILDIAESVGIVERNKAWYTYKGVKFQKGDFPKYQDEILQTLIDNEQQSINVEIDEEDEEATLNSTEIRKERIKKDKKS